MESKLCNVPFCSPTCTGHDHHPLIKILCDFPCDTSAPCQSQQSRLEDAITDAQANGWGISDEVPERSPICPKLPLMHWAAVLGKGRALKLLVKEGFSTKVIHPGTTALSLAMRNMLTTFAKCSEISHLLAGFQLVAEVLYKFDRSVADKQGRIALNLACEQYVTALAQPGAECTFRRNVLFVLLSLTDGTTTDGSALINHADNEKKSCLHVLAQRDDCVEFVDALLGKGADPTLRNVDGKTPCEVAQGLGQHQVARRLFRASPVAVTAIKRPPSPELVATMREAPGSAIPAPPPSTVPIAIPSSADVSQQVREHVKNHVTSRHTQQQQLAAVQQSDGHLTVMKSSFQAQMAGKVKELRDVCSVEFAVVNQQRVPAADLSACRRPPPARTNAVANGVSTVLLPSPAQPVAINGELILEGASTVQHYEQASALSHGHSYQTGISSPPPLLSGSVCNGRGSVRPVATIGASTLDVATTDDHFATDSSVSSSSSDDDDPVLDDEVMFEEADGFVVTMRQIKTSLCRDALVSIVGAETERRRADCRAAINQQREAKAAHADLLRQARAERRQHEAILAEIEEAKAQMVYIHEEMEHRSHRAADLDHERVAIDSQYKLAQLQHMACSRALESIPLAFQMNIAFDEDLAGAEQAACLSASASNMDTPTPYFDTASVSSMPPFQSSFI